MDRMDRMDRRWFKYLVVFNLVYLTMLPVPTYGQGVVDSCANFTWRLLTQRYRTYSKLPVEVPVRKQCGSTCWANAAASYIELLAKSQNGTDFRPSVDYMLMSRLSESLANHDFRPTDFSHIALARTREFGLLNESQWPQKFPLEKHWNQLMGELQAAQQEHMRQLKAIRLSDDVGAKNLAFQISINRFNDSLPKIIQSVMGKDFMEFMRDQEIRLLARRTFDPLSHTITAAKRYKRLIEQPTDVMGSRDSFLKPILNENDQANLPMMMELIKQAIDDGRPVVASVYWTHSGRLAHGSILHSTISVPFVERGGGHAVTVIGYRDNGILIQNSYGSGRGDRGYFELTTNYLQRNLNSIVVPVP